MKILAIGDIFADEGLKIAERYLDLFAKNYDLIIANGENSAGGFGITPNIANSLLQRADLITTGNHIWDKRDIYEYLDREPRLLRPHNYPEKNPGKGYLKLDVKGEEVLVLNLQGSVFMQPLKSAFVAADELLEEHGCKTVILDFHAEATAEKIALLRHLQGRISLMFGTHTHVQTNDATIFEGTGYCTDIGMTGSQSGVIGVEAEIIVKRFLTNMPRRFTPSKGDIYFHGLEANIEDGKCVDIRVIREREEDLC